MRMMDTTIVKLLRCLMQGKAVKSECSDAIKVMTNQEVLNHWKMADSGTELRVRRLKWYAKWSGDPAGHVQELAAILGTANVELVAGKTTLLEGKVTEQANPWARQLVEDVLQLLRKS